MGLRRSICYPLSLAPMRWRINVQKGRMKITGVSTPDLTFLTFTTFYSHFGTHPHFFSHNLSRIITQFGSEGDKPPSTTLVVSKVRCSTGTAVRLAVGLAVAEPVYPVTWNVSTLVSFISSMGTY